MNFKGLKVGPNLKVEQFQNKEFVTMFKTVLNTNDLQYPCAVIVN